MRLKKLIIASFIFSGLGIQNINACTSFGFISPNGITIAKNSDYYYDKQSVEILVPNKQFSLWYDNKYGNNYKIFAQMANNNIKMGINEAGLVAMEEDPLLPKDRNHRRYIQPNGGTAECMTLWGILQNFKTVEQLRPYIEDIFSHAAPNHYEIADSQKILIVEVGYGADDKSPVRPYSYKILDQSMESYTHTNTYQDKKFLELNNLAANSFSTKGAIARNERIKSLINTKESNEEIISSWLFDTSSSVLNPSDSKYCMGTSIFRSNLGKKSEVTNNKNYTDTYGTVASMIVFISKDPDLTKITVRLIDNITTDKKGDQTINYKELQARLPDLFNNNYKFTSKSLVRSHAINGVCN